MMSIVIKCLVVILGLFLLRELYFSMASIRALRWRSVQGKIEKWDMGTEPDESLTFVRNLEYKYSVQGKDYQSSTIGYGFPFEVEQFYARKALNEVLADAPALTVYYDPTNPNLSVLIRGFRRFHAARLSIVLFCFAFMCVVLFSEPV